MAQVQTRAPVAPRETERVKPPSVLVILVVKDGVAWLPQCLAGLAKQTHPRIGVLAVDNGSSDDSCRLLESALGQERVIRLDQNVGFAGAVNRALQSSLAEEADYLLLLHDDTILAPGAVAGLVDAATRIDGVGVVGPKVLDWERPQILREIGQSTDRFGYPYSPLEDGEIDQGQYDRIREVRFVSSCAMLVSRQALLRVGPPDERLTTHYEDLDLCWRAQLAGYRVLMTPRAMALHRGATLRQERAGEPPSRARYERERAALACMLKNYGVLSLIWILPLYLALGLAKMLTLGASRRFEEAYQLLAAWAWNARHLPGTVRRRIRAQAVRTVPDRSVRRSMAPAGYRLRKWAVTAGQARVPRFDREEPGPWLPTVARYARAYPVATAWALALVLAIVAYRHLFSAGPVSGGGLGSVPGSPFGYFRELFSGLRHTGLGGAEAASPALGLLGLGSLLSFGSPVLLQKIMLLGLPAAAAAGCYRAVRALTEDRLPAVVSGACYGLSSAVLWALSQGRIPVLVLLAGLPWLATRIGVAFDRGAVVRPLRWVAGAALGLAVIGSFFPGVVLAGALLVACSLLAARGRARRLRGVGLVGAALAGAALLVLPLTLDLARSGAGALSDAAGSPSFGALARLSLGRAPGAWTVAFYLPVAAALSLVFVSGRLVGPAVRATAAGIAAMYLAWLAAAGYLPVALSNPTAYVAVLAFSYATLVGIGLACLTRGVARAAFGHRQLGAAIMTVVVGGGLVAQAAQAGRGAWMVGGPERVPPAYLVAGQPGQPYRVLWLGRADGDPFPAPGGLPQGSVAAGVSSVRFAVTGPSGASGFDIGRPDTGPGYRYLRQALFQIMAGSTRHGGSLLAPLGIRYIVANPNELPPGASHRLRRQLDLDHVFAQGLTIFGNAKAAPAASEIPDAQWLAGAFSQDSRTRSELPVPPALALPARSRDVFAGGAVSQSSLVFLAQQFDPRWRLVPQGGGKPLVPQRAFGTGVGFRAASGSPAFLVRFGGQRARTFQIALMAILWGLALAVTRRPVRG